MTRRSSMSWLWSLGAACGLFALVACQGTTPEGSTSEASPAPEKVAVEATPENAVTASSSPTTAPSRTVRSPKVTAPVDEIPFEGKRIAIVHTANVIGELEPCG